MPQQELGLLRGLPLPADGARAGEHARGGALPGGSQHWRSKLAVVCGALVTARAQLQGMARSIFALMSSTAGAWTSLAFTGRGVGRPGGAGGGMQRCEALRGSLDNKRIEDFGLDAYLGRALSAAGFQL